MVTEAEARRVRPLMSGIVALAVALVAAIGWYYLGRPDESQRPVRTVEWKTWVQAGRADKQLQMLAPAELPDGWRARYATYQSGVSPTWRLAMLTDKGKFVGLQEGRQTSADLIAASTEGEATRGAPVDIAGASWQSYTSSGDYLLLRALQGPRGTAENLIVYGSAPPEEIRAFAASLQGTAD